jgi:hypothetical protein
VPPNCRTAGAFVLAADESRARGLVAAVGAGAASVDPPRQPLRQLVASLT